MKIDFDALIDRHINHESRPKSIGRYYPSEIGKCIRKTWYTYKYPVQIDPSLRRIFELGNILHDFIVEVLKDSKDAGIELLQAEIPFKIPYNDFLISGRVDDLMLLDTGKRKVLAEVKSTKSIKRITPVSHHKMQLQFYMYAMKVHDGVLLYVDKATLETKSFSVTFSQKQAKRILNKFRALHKHLTNGTLPAPEAKKQKDTRWECDYCEYREKCKNEEK